MQHVSIKYTILFVFFLLQFDVDSFVYGIAKQNTTEAIEGKHKSCGHTVNAENLSAAAATTTFLMLTTAGSITACWSCVVNRNLLRGRRQTCELHQRRDNDHSQRYQMTWESASLPRNNHYTHAVLDSQTRTWFCHYWIRVCTVILLPWNHSTKMVISMSSHAYGMGVQRCSSSMWLDTVHALICRRSTWTPIVIGGNQTWNHFFFSPLVFYISRTR